ncbi:nitrous oxide reductase accessory protein NosL [Benzoatithermus flavus]|uniref:Nitrous oxide reductase accessory protein NosL n=1 Tax=Benzoatithermus flavus TaxID=3108223 RepID=A0ABU8XT50_9PROT
MSFLRTCLLGLAMAASLAACGEQEAKAPPPPARMTAEAVGYYCQMYVLEHEGPKAQIHLESQAAPVWFSQVRDAVAYMRRPDEPRDIVAVYVSDMGRAPSWGAPGEDNWIDAKAAVYVIESRAVGAMGAPEAVPFGERAAAERFVEERGGRIVALAEIPDGYVLGSPAELVATEHAH